jgi:hypothetical protein
MRSRLMLILRKIFGKKHISLKGKSNHNEEGTKANGTFMTIVQTAKKLGVSAYHYMCDRVGGTFEMPSLAQLIKEKSLVSGR